jgi:hypothetical protein
VILGTHQDIVDPKFTIKKQTKEEKKKEIATQGLGDSGSGRLRSKRPRTMPNPA